MVDEVDFGVHTEDGVGGSKPSRPLFAAPRSIVYPLFVRTSPTTLGQLVRPHVSEVACNRTTMVDQVDYGVHTEDGVGGSKL
jgi:hypothetical protein